MQKGPLSGSNTTRCITINLQHANQNNWLVVHVVLAVFCTFQIPVHVPQKHTAVVMPSIGFTSKEPNNSFYSRTEMACYRTKAFCEEKSWANQFYAQLSLFPGRQLNNVCLSVYYFCAVPESSALGHDSLGLLSMVHHLRGLLGKELYSNSVWANLHCVCAYKYGMSFYQTLTRPFLLVTWTRMKWTWTKKKILVSR